MKRMSCLTAIALLITSAPASPSETPHPTAQDNRIREVIYSDTQVFRIVGVFRSATQIRKYLDDELVTELVINRPGEVGIERRGGWTWECEPSLDFKNLMALATAAAAFTSQDVTRENPIVSTIFPTGERVQIIVPPVVPDETVSITVRKPSTVTMTLADFQASGLFILDEFARLGRASVIASAFSYVAGYGIRLLPVIQSRSQLRGVYGEHVADEIVANCGVEVAFTPKDVRVANELSERLGYVGQASVTRSLTINGWLANRSKSISEQRRALMLPQELMQFPSTKLILLRGGIPPIIGSKIFYFKSRFFVKRVLPPPVVPPAEKQTRIAVMPAMFRDMTDEEAEGNPAHPLSPNDIRTEDYPSFHADLLTLDHDGKVTGIIEEGDEHG